MNGANHPQECIPQHTVVQVAGAHVPQVVEEVQEVIMVISSGKDINKALSSTLLMSLPQVVKDILEVPAMGLHVSLSLRC